MKITISDTGEIQIPAVLRKQDHIEAGQQFDIERLNAGQYLLKQQTKSPQPGSSLGCKHVPSTIGLCPFQMSDCLDASL